MKLITLIVAIVLSVSVKAQETPFKSTKEAGDIKKILATNGPKADTAWKPSTVKEEFICIEDVDTFLQEVAGKTLLTPQEFLKLRDAMTAIIAQAIERKRKEVKNK